MSDNQSLPEAAPLDVAGIKAEALHMIRMGLRGQHSNNKIVRLCAAIEQQSDRIATLENLVREAVPMIRGYRPAMMDKRWSWLDAAVEAVGGDAK